MDLKNNKPLIIIAAALSLAVITIAIQVVFLTFTLKEQKDTLRYISSSTDVHAIQSKLNGMQTSMIELSRDVQDLTSITSRQGANLNALTSVSNKVSNENEFMRQELNAINSNIKALHQRINALEHRINTLHSQDEHLGMLTPLPTNDRPALPAMPE